MVWEVMRRRRVMMSKKIESRFMMFELSEKKICELFESTRVKERSEPIDNFTYTELKNPRRQ